MLRANNAMNLCKFLEHFKYFLKEGFKSVFSNRFMSVASILVMVCCLLLIGISILMYENIRSTLGTIEGQNSITVYLDSDISPGNIEEEIKSNSNISSCAFYSREEAMEEYEGLLGEKITGFFRGEGNPLPDAFHVTMFDLSKYDMTAAELLRIKGVETISDRSEIAKKLSDLKRLVTILGFWIVFSLSAVSLMIISNTIRITMHNRRFEISIMKSIGATNSFVRFPFIVEGIILGVVSAAISVFALEFIYKRLIALINSVIPFYAIPFDKFSREISIIFGAVGLILGISGGMISIGRYLKREGSEAVAW